MNESGTSNFARRYLEFWMKPSAHMRSIVYSCFPVVSDRICVWLIFSAWKDALSTQTGLQTSFVWVLYIEPCQLKLLPGRNYLQANLPDFPAEQCLIISLQIPEIDFRSARDWGGRWPVVNSALALLCVIQQLPVSLRLSRRPLTRHLPCPRGWNSATQTGRLCSLLWSLKRVMVMPAKHKMHANSLLWKSSQEVTLPKRCVVDALLLQWGWCLKYR